MPRNRSLIAASLLVVAILLGGWSCRTGDVALKAQSATIDALKLAGSTVKLVAGPMDATCRAGLPKTVEVCDTWYVFIKGKDPKNPLCASPTVGAIATVHRSCGFKVSYKTIVGAYEANKDLGVAAASVVESIVQQVTGFAEKAGG